MKLNKVKKGKSEFKLLFLDFETTPLEMLGWGLYQPSFNHKFIRQEKTIISFHYMFEGDKKPRNVSIADNMKLFLANPRDDYEVCKKVHEIMSEADAIVAHFGKGFDFPLIRLRCAYHGLPPLPKVKEIDTKKMAVEAFGRLAACNKLDYLCKLMGLGHKIRTNDDDWIGILAGDKKSLKTMVRYGDYDVVLLHRLYHKLLPLVKAPINMNLVHGEVDLCPTCGGDHLQKRGYIYNNTTKRNRYKCNDCGSWSAGDIVKLPKGLQRKRTKR